jgi:hypothetical protein
MNNYQYEFDEDEEADILKDELWGNFSAIVMKLLIFDSIDQLTHVIHGFFVVWQC